MIAGDEDQLKTPEMPPLLRTIDELEFLLLRAPEPHERILLEQYATISKNQLQLDYAGGKRVAVVEKSWRNFLNGLRKLGYVLSADSTVV